MWDKALLAILDAYANQKNITYQWESLLEICKGKWLLKRFCKHIMSITEDLVKKCRNKDIKSCQYCQNDHVDNCQYKIKAAIRVNENNLVDLVINNGSLDNLDYLKSHVENLV